MSSKNRSRQNAIEHGERYYVGSACKTCGCRVRYLSGNCATCTINKAEAAYKVKRARRTIRLVTEAFL